MEFENIASFNPKECISGRMNRMNRIIANIFRKHIKPFGVTDSQLTLLFILSKRSGLNQKQLAEIAVLEKSSLNRNLSRLLDSKLVTKKEFPAIDLTHKGKTLVNKIIPEWEKAMQEIKQILEPEGEKSLQILTQKLLP